jgi:hypothetical protein
VSVFFKLITALFSVLTPLSCAIFRGFKISPWACIGIVGFVVLKLSYQIFWLSNTFLLLPGVGWATIVMIYIATSIMVALSTKTVKVSRPKFSCFQSDSS